MHGADDAMEWLMASQNAFPKVSSAHAIQLSGSPEHLRIVVDGDDGSGMTGKTGLVLDPPDFRRSGTGAW